MTLDREQYDQRCSGKENQVSSEQFTDQQALAAL